MGLLTCYQVVDGELEEDGAHVSRASLTQHFPFEACPPTTKQASHSPCLQRLIEAVTASKDAMTVAERNSLIKVCTQTAILKKALKYGNPTMWAVTVQEGLDLALLLLFKYMCCIMLSSSCQKRNAVALYVLSKVLPG